MKPRTRHEPKPVNIAELEREAECDRRTADEDLTRRINAAVCAELGHERPQSGAFSESVDIVSWGSVEPIVRLGPYCLRCRANLSEDT